LGVTYGAYVAVLAASTVHNRVPTLFVSGPRTTFLHGTPATVAFNASSSGGGGNRVNCVGLPNWEPVMVRVMLAVVPSSSSSGLGVTPVMRGGKYATGTGCETGLSWPLVLWELLSSS
jgi:hypothetical protein